MKTLNAIKKLQRGGWKVEGTSNPMIVKATKEHHDDIRLFRNGGDCAGDVAVIEVGYVNVFADSIAQAMRIAAPRLDDALPRAEFQQKVNDAEMRAL